MKIIKINIARSATDNELAKITAYTGVKSSPQPSLEEIDRIATADNDSRLIDTFWSHAANALADHVRQFIADLSLSDTDLHLTLEVSEAFDNSLTQSITKGAEAFISAHMAKSWFALTLPEKGKEWDAECSRILTELSRTLFHRRKPARKKGAQTTNPEA